jgi:hypothetical protein
VTGDYTADWADSGYHEESVRLPDGNMIVMGKETFLAPEILFQVSRARLDMLQKRLEPCLPSQASPARTQSASLPSSTPP